MSESPVDTIPYMERTRRLYVSQAPYRGSVDGPDGRPVRGPAPA